MSIGNRSKTILSLILILICLQEDRSSVEKNPHK